MACLSGLGGAFEIVTEVTLRRHAIPEPIAGGAWGSPRLGISVKRAPSGFDHCDNVGPVPNSSLGRAALFKQTGR
jgi:hypothetical protein